MKDNKIINIRALAIFLVVFGHSIILYEPSWGVYTTSNSSNISNSAFEL